MERFRNRFLKTFFSKRSQDTKLKSSNQPLKLHLLRKKRRCNAKPFNTFPNLTPIEIQLLLDNVVYPEDMELDGIT